MKRNIFSEELNKITFSANDDNRIELIASVKRCMCNK